MKCPLRTFAIFVAVFLSLCVCSSFFPGQQFRRHRLDQRQLPLRQLRLPPSPGRCGLLCGWPPSARRSLRTTCCRCWLATSSCRAIRGALQTEFLLLLDRYVQQARELQILAGPENIIHVDNCDDAGTLVQILGYRLRESCGQKTFFLETANPESAFLTIDSGFPLTELEEALQKGVPFNYPYAPSRVPVLFQRKRLDYAERGPEEEATPMWWTCSSTTPPWPVFIGHSPRSTPRRGSPCCSLPDLEGCFPTPLLSIFTEARSRIRSGHVIVPGGAWTQVRLERSGRSKPRQPRRVRPPAARQRQRLARRVLRCLVACQRVAARASHRRRPPEALLRRPSRHRHRAPAQRGESFDRLPISSSCSPASNGRLTASRTSPEISRSGNRSFARRPIRRSIHDWNKHGHGLDHPEQLLDAMVAFSRVVTDIGPLQIYLTMCEIDNGRAPDKRLSPETVSLLASKFSQFSNWYLVFSEFPDLSDESATRFVNVAESIDKISNESLRGNTLGAFQANIGLWQILARQGEIPAPN